MKKQLFEKVTDISVLDVSKLSESDVVLVSVDVGNMPMHKIQEYLTTLKDAVRSIVPEPIQVLIKPNSINIQVDTGN